MYTNCVMHACTASNQLQVMGEGFLVRAGEPELGAPEPNIFDGARAGALICICCGAGAGVRAMSKTISSNSKWLKNLTKTSL